MTRRRDPVDLVGWAVAGSALAASSWFLSFVPVPRVHVEGCGLWAVLSADRLRFLVYLAPVILGLVTSIWAEKRFNRGFRDDLWTEAELARVRSLLAHSAWRWAGWFVFAGACVSLLLARSFGHGGLVYLLFLPVGTGNRLRLLITPRARVSSGLADWRNFGQLRSEHWGEPRS